jgi:hypothetical protein
VWKWFNFGGLLVDLTGIEPVTSSMPWNEANIKILTAKDLLAGRVGKTGLIGDICDENATNFLTAGQTG